MIKFFKKIRQNLLMENKTGKYFKYAIGEIILVVIGILIALQLNNWNESRKDSIFERKVISELSVDVSQDIEEMNNALDSINVSQRSSYLIIQHIENKAEYHDSLNKHFMQSLRLWSLSPNKMAFEMAKEEGMYFISNDSIRFYASKVNGYTYDYIQVIENRFQDYKSNIVLPHIQSLFNSYNFISMKPNNYEELKQDKTYLSIIKSIIAMRTRYKSALEYRYNELNKLNSIIQKEIEQQ
ncbi:hypothetical protein WNY78_06590 [Psychroserpens sp. AS72]|uniref:hypothetical protein n=1 Tax=Psychroserpens sp. AS72 TaxID=3135775 RepID=UPI003171C4F7